MNYARLKEWLDERVEDLVEMGVPRVAAAEIIGRLEFDTVNAECKERQERQFLLDFLQVGSKTLAERSGKSQQWVRKRRQILLNKRCENATEKRAHVAR